MRQPIPKYFLTAITTTTMIKITTAWGGRGRHCSSLVSGSPQPPPRCHTSPLSPSLFSTNINNSENKKILCRSQNAVTPTWTYAPNSDVIEYAPANTLGKMTMELTRRILSHLLTRSLIHSFICWLRTTRCTCAVTRSRGCQFHTISLCGRARCAS